MTVQILVPEYVPLENKGEEAIVRGMGDIVCPDGNYEIHLFDMVENYEFRDGIHVYPLNWFMYEWHNSEFGLNWNYERLLASAQSLVKNILHKLAPYWVRFKTRRLKQRMELLRQLKDKSINNNELTGIENLLKVDVIIAGHDGGLDERVAHFINEYISIFDVPLWVFGVEFPNKFKSSHIAKEIEKGCSSTRAMLCRTEASRQSVLKHMPSFTPEVSPDPAFSMKPMDREEVILALDKYGLSKVFNNGVICVSTCETGPIARHCFPEFTDPSARLDAHRQFLADIISNAVEEFDKEIVFLPHALGPGKALNDITVAKAVKGKMSKSAQNRTHILNEDLPAPMLKGIIREADFMISERIHAMIGAVGVATPFLCLGSKTDRRIKGILTDLVGCGDQVVYMNEPSLEKTLDRLRKAYLSRDEISKSLESVALRFKKLHYQVGDSIRQNLKE
jgi:polysaccharide pyruvyl transferase WcaK-like protein